MHPTCPLRSEASLFPQNGKSPYRVLDRAFGPKLREQRPTFSDALQIGTVTASNASQRWGEKNSDALIDARASTPEDSDGADYFHRFFCFSWRRKRALWEGLTRGIFVWYVCEFSLDSELLEKDARSFRQGRAAVKEREREKKKRHLSNEIRNNYIRFFFLFQLFFCCRFALKEKTFFNLKV